MKDRILSLLFVSILFVFSIITFIKSDNDTDFFERRKLVTKEKLKSDFSENLDNYLTDQFFLRDKFISLNSLVNRYIFNNVENNGVYLFNDYLIEKNYPLDEKSVNGFINKINYIKEKYLNEANVSYSIIPDKSYFLDEKRYLKIDFNSLIERIKNGINVNYLDIFTEFDIKDYYKGDIHIKQDSYFKILPVLDEFLDFNYEKISYKNSEDYDFYGASVGKIGAYIGSEKLLYYTNDVINNAKVNHLEFGEKKVYDVDELKGVDAYNVFLSGPSALIEIENGDSLTDKELIIFRDSFASSLAPLLIPYYKKIILVDLRYINMNIVREYIDFYDKNVLFLYSTLIINNSNILKVY